jgi:hypothetical protein
MVIGTAETTGVQFASFELQVRNSWCDLLHRRNRMRQLFERDSATSDSLQNMIWQFTLISLLIQTPIWRRLRNPNIACCALQRDLEYEAMAMGIRGNSHLEGGGSRMQFSR